MTNDKKICVGAIVGVHGVRGQVRLASFTDDPEAIFDYAPLMDEKATRVFALTFRGTGKDHYIASIKGVATREEAEALKGTRLYVERATLPPEEEGTYYHADLMGLKAQDAAGKPVGIVENVFDYGAGTFLEIKPTNAKSFMLPFKDAFVPTVDLIGGFIEVIIPEGWLAEEKPPKEKKKKEKADD